MIGYPGLLTPVTDIASRRTYTTGQVDIIGAGGEFRMDARVQGGNSGSPIVTTDGRVLGIIVRGIGIPQIAESLGGIWYFGLTESTGAVGEPVDDHTK